MDKPDISNLIIANKEGAERVLGELKGIIKKFGFTTVDDLYTLCGLTTSYIDAKWGWKSLEDIQIKQTDHGYLIELPPLEEI